MFLICKAIFYCIALQIILGNKDCILKYIFNQHSKCILIETLTFFRDLGRTHKILGCRILPSLTLQIHHCSLYKSLVLFYLLIFETNSLRGISAILVAGQSYQPLVCAFFPPQVSWVRQPSKDCSTFPSYYSYILFLTPLGFTMSYVIGF